MKFVAEQTLTRPSLDVKWSFPLTDHVKSPWKLLGFDEQPNWWSTQYGPAPYTESNECWTDIENGEIKAGDTKGIHPELKREFIKFWLDDHNKQQEFVSAGKIVSIEESGYDTLVYTCKLTFDTVESYDEFTEQMADSLENNSAALRYDHRNNIVFAETTSFI